MTEQNAPKDSSWNWICDGLATTDKTRAIFAQMVSMKMTERSVLQYLWLPVFSVSVTLVLQFLQSFADEVCVYVTKLNLETKPHSVFIMYFCKLL